MTTNDRNLSPGGSRLLVPMTPRDPNEHARSATPLELLFDLCFVVAIAQLAAGLHHAIAEGHAVDGVGGFVMVFMAIWWAWMGFTWFASSFDTDDAAYRLKVLVQMVGVLVLAAGVSRAFNNQDFRLITVGYAIMRVGLVALWLRAARADVAVRKEALRYAIGISVLQVFWLALLWAPAELWIYGWMILVPLELMVPMWAERADNRRFHRHHISERYGLFTIIVIGESVLACTVAIQAAVDLGSPPAHLIQVIVAAPLILFAMWWLYFSQPGHALLSSTRSAFLWGYGHFFVFASAAAVGAAIAAAVDHAIGASHVTDLQAALALAIPISLYLLSVWFVQIRPQPDEVLCGRIFILAAGVVLLCVLTPFPELAMAFVLVLATMLVVMSVERRQTAASSS